MNLQYAFLADAAQFTPDGKLWVLGGDIGQIPAAVYPAVHLAMTLVVKLEVQLTECEREHRLRVVLLDPDGTSIIPPLELNFTPQPNPVERHRPVGMGLGINLQQVRFAAPGDYGVHILVDDLQLGVVPLQLIQTAPPPPEPQ